MKLKLQIIGVLEEGKKAPYEIAHELRMRRKRQLMKLKDAINELYASDIIDTFDLNGQKTLYLRKCK